MRHLLLAEAEARVSQSHVLAVIFARIIEIRLSFNVISLALGEKKSVLQMRYVRPYRIRRNADARARFQRVGNLGGIRQRADRGTEKVENHAERVLALDFFALHDVFQIDLRKKRLQIIHLRSLVRARKHERHTAVKRVLLEGLVPAAAGGGQKFRKTERVDADLVAAPAELRKNIRRKHLRIAARHVNVEIRQAAQVVQRVVEGYLLSSGIVRISRLVGHLYLVDEKIIFILFPLRYAADVGRELERIAEANVARQVELD